eukprot:gene12740-16191_t
MMIWSEELAVIPVTIHIPLEAVPRQLTTGLIVETGRIAASDLTRRFGVARPRLALCGLNPHAGEGGSLGKEDAAVIAPAVEQLQALGIEASGPYPADTLFHARARAGYDVALGMYHDQALIPIKLLDFDDGVNVTLGLPIVRTSPDHGTAFDIAGTGVARPGATIAALRMAAACAKSLGQNFLFDEQLLARIATVPGPLRDADVLEVGPGPGGLTRALLRAGARVTAIEMDRRCMP